MSEPPDGNDKALWTLLADALEPAAPSAQVRRNLLAAVRGPQRYAPFAQEAALAFAVDEGAMQQALRLAADPQTWEGQPMVTTDALQQVGAAIVRLAPGSRFPDHTHRQRELTYVLDGELTEDGGERYGPGDLMAKATGSKHGIHVSSVSDCLVVFGLVPPEE